MSNLSPHDKNFVSTIKSIISQRRPASGMPMADRKEPVIRPVEAEEPEMLAEAPVSAEPTTSDSHIDNDRPARQLLDPEDGSESDFEWASRGTKGPYDENFGMPDEGEEDADSVVHLEDEPDTADDGLSLRAVEEHTDTEGEHAEDAVDEGADAEDASSEDAAAEDAIEDEASADVVSSDDPDAESDPEETDESDAGRGGNIVQMRGFGRFLSRRARTDIEDEAPEPEVTDDTADALDAEAATDIEAVDDDPDVEQQEAETASAEAGPLDPDAVEDDAGDEAVDDETETEDAWAAAEDGTVEAEQDASAEEVGDAAGEDEQTDEPEDDNFLTNRISAALALDPPRAPSSESTDDTEAAADEPEAEADDNSEDDADELDADAVETTSEDASQSLEDDYWDASDEVDGDDTPEAAPDVPEAEDLDAAISAAIDETTPEAEDDPETSGPAPLLLDTPAEVPQEDDPSPLRLVAAARVGNGPLELKAEHPDPEPLFRSVSEAHLQARIGDLIREEMGELIDQRIEVKLRELLGDDLSRIRVNRDD